MDDQGAVGEKHLVLFEQPGLLVRGVVDGPPWEIEPCRLKQLGKERWRERKSQQVFQIVVSHVKFRSKT